MLTLSAYGAVQDHLLDVEIFHTIDNGAPDSTNDTFFTFELMATTDETVESIAVQCPGGRPFTISKTAGQNGTEWTLYESEGLTAI